MAMLQSVGQHGYGATTVAEVVARAGVSRKAFYEHFANKQECLLAAYDVIAREGRRRIAHAYLEADGLPGRIESAINTLFELATENPDALRLITTEIAAAGPAGIERRERAVLEFGELISAGLGAGVDSATMPESTLRAIVGGLNRVLAIHLRRGRRTKPQELVPALMDWVASYHPTPQTLHAALAAKNAGHDCALAEPLGGRAPGTLSPRTQLESRRGATRRGATISRSFVVQSQRERILDAVTNLAATKGYNALTVEDIASEGAVSLQAFYQHFESKEDSFIVAYELGHNKGLDIVERAFAMAADWPSGVRDGLSALIGYLTSEPSFAHLSLLGTLIATPRAAELSTRGLAAYAQLLAPGLEEVPHRNRPPPVTIDATAGGLHELFLHYAAQGRTRDLADLTIDATYIALAPFIGAEEAARVAVG
jgi:AcrR family transcriptional regulator